MVGAEVLREYLVKLGFSIDNTAQAKIKETLTVLEKQLDSLSKGKAFAVLTHGALGFVGAISAVVTASAGLMQHVAEADMHYQKLALSMHMSTQNAKELSIAQKALGSSLEEIVWIPELREHYHELRKLVNETQAPKEDLELIRKMGFEYTKFKVLLISASEHIAASLIKYLKVNLVDIKKWMENANKWLKENLPIWTEKIADFLRRVWGVGQALIQMIQSLIGILPEGSRAFVAFFAAIALGMKINPTLMMLAALFLLIEDWWTWKQGKELGLDNKTMFGNMWESLETISGPFTASLKTLDQVFKDLFGQSFSLTFWKAFNGIVSSLAFGIATIAHEFNWLVNLAALGAKLFASSTKADIIKEYDEKVKPKQEEILKLQSSPGTNTKKDKERIEFLRAEISAAANLREQKLAEVDKQNIAEFKVANLESRIKLLETYETLDKNAARYAKELQDYEANQHQGKKNAVTPANANDIPMVYMAKGKRISAEEAARLGFPEVAGKDVSTNAPAWDYNTGIPGNGATIINFYDTIVKTDNPDGFWKRMKQEKFSIIGAGRNP